MELASRERELILLPSMVRSVPSAVDSAGTVDGLIDLGGGADTFNGGAKAETVRDAAGDDTYNFGKGNDTYIAFTVRTMTSSTASRM